MQMRALAVDDEADIRRLLEIKLTKAGYRVSTATDGDEGLRLALAERPDLMVVDVMMPGKDGFQVVSEVKAALGAEAPVAILLTARGEHADVAAGLANGADDYVTKPFSPHELLERARVALIRAGRAVP
ncbi:MAG: response regulator transcription factor [Deferrisomatales bacterium]